MSVAQSYQKYEIFGDPYEHDKRQYVKIKYPCCRKLSCQKCGGQGFYLKEVRWYDEPVIFNARQGFGFFEKGYITLFKGPEAAVEEYCKANLLGKVRYNTLFFWHLPSTYEIPINLPSNISTIQLNFNEIASKETIGDYDMIRDYVSDLLSDSQSNSEFIGVVGDTFQGELIVINDTLKQGYYGDTHTYIFEDEFQNRYSWTTSARKLSVGEKYCLRGTIKEHLKLEGIKHTVLTRCREV